MTDDIALLKILGAAEGAGAKVILVGDHLQLGPVGPGGAFEALLRRHRDAVQVLSENVRQRDRAERDALSALRCERVEEAVSFYMGHGRVRISDTRVDALEAAVADWGADRESGRDSVLLAWRRQNVSELNRRARARLEEVGHLQGPELRAEGGRRYRAGDKVVLLAPVPQAGLVTSERATVVSVDARHKRLEIETEDGRRVLLQKDQISAERLDHAYAMTVHRMHGSTTEISRLYSDGGGRELAYVAMSRAREASFVYAVADTQGQAAEDLCREWSISRRPHWASELGWPSATRPAQKRPRLSEDKAAAVRLAHLRAERQAVLGAIPPDPSDEVAFLKNEIHSAERDLSRGEGRFEETEIGKAVHEVKLAELDIAISQKHIESPRFPGDVSYWQEVKDERKADLQAAEDRGCSRSRGERSNPVFMSCAPRLRTSTKRGRKGSAGWRSIPKPRGVSITSMMKSITAASRSSVFDAKQAGEAMTAEELIIMRTRRSPSPRRTPDTWHHSHSPHVRGHGHEVGFGR